MMGFHVVGRLAARHGIKVRLRDSWFGGVTALVLLPAALLGSAGEPSAMASPVPVGAVASPPPNRGRDTDAAAEAGEPFG
jgi:hypothetical protein